VIRKIAHKKRDGSVGQSYAEDDGVDHDEYDPRPCGGLDAKEGDDDGEQVDGRYGETPDQEEAHRGGVLGLSSNLSCFTEYHCMAVKSSLPTARVAA
jgi:hypothetical protein